ncbi:hypothetical protein [Paenibacillus bouchesdurhonensis]|uniref:hypothetical protein n=1 Tax=Paenibacillus bouchesdurhonensis TaxID=1870990 RepID=UPI000DA62BD0|nr:hypothetical protein [Paenibacillus bouchesdurhonensis]
MMSNKDHVNNLVEKRLGEIEREAEVLRNTINSLQEEIRAEEGKLSALGYERVQLLTYLDGYSEMNHVVKKNINCSECGTGFIFKK